MTRRLPLLWALAGVGCTTGAALQLEFQTMQSQLNQAREAGAYRCAPKDLAEAESQLEFLGWELEQGNAVRADQHRTEARKSLVSVLETMKTCPPVVHDRDGDGVLDDVDACPDVPGLPELKGCPDRDGDGITDALDKCPDVPEDRDGNQDDDGCPETEDRDGDGVMDPDDGCPDIPGPVDNKGCPYGDRDGDGILDKDDKCPDAPEDKDQFEDEDGCPDPDNDGDGILDPNDKCPLIPENMNGFEDEDGCPDQKLELVEINRETKKIEIKQKVFFDTGKATIKSVSFRLLNEVAQVIRANPTMRVLVEGHTDNVGSDATNMRLSQARSESVKTYLVGQGVESERLEAQGFGEDRPIDSNRTKAGRERNRRVEFTITGE